MMRLFVILLLLPGCALFKAGLEGLEDSSAILLEVPDGYFSIYTAPNKTLPAPFFPPGLVTAQSDSFAYDIVLAHGIAQLCTEENKGYKLPLGIMHRTSHEDSDRFVLTCKPPLSGGNFDLSRHKQLYLEVYPYRGGVLQQGRPRLAEVHLDETYTLSFALSPGSVAYRVAVADSALAREVWPLNPYPCEEDEDGRYVCEVFIGHGWTDGTRRTGMAVHIRKRHGY